MVPPATGAGRRPPADYPLAAGVGLLQAAAHSGIVGHLLHQLLHAGAGKTIFIGLRNYAELLPDQAVGYVLFAIIGQALFTVPLQLGASIFLAALLSSPRLVARTALRTLSFLPSITPVWRSCSCGWVSSIPLQAG